MITVHNRIWCFNMPEFQSLSFYLASPITRVRTGLFFLSLSVTSIPLKIKNQYYGLDCKYPLNLASFSGHQAFWSPSVCSRAKADNTFHYNNLYPGGKKKKKTGLCSIRSIAAREKFTSFSQLEAVALGQISMFLSASRWSQEWNMTLNLFLKRKRHRKGKLNLQESALCQGERN